MSESDDREEFTAKPKARWVERLLEFKYERKQNIKDERTRDIADTKNTILGSTCPSRPVDQETAQYLRYNAHVLDGALRRIDQQRKVGVQIPAYDMEDPTPFTVIVVGVEDGKRYNSPFFIIRFDDIDTPEEFVERGLYTGGVPDDPETIKHEIKQWERFK
ncbi:hypothetical protein OSG_eHP36_00180 [environmental Halophage eHP-36]|jgi:hypothetical protein|nr:hypothetical protein OSG_eHP36_00180 [environmental Halophage eHP-36]